jgi:hypothetical protein
LDQLVISGDRYASKNPLLIGEHLVVSYFIFLLSACFAVKILYRFGEKKMNNATMQRCNV